MRNYSILLSIHLVTTACTVVQGKLLYAMSHSKGKPENRTHRSSETTWPGTTKFGTSSLMPNRGPNTKIGENRLRVV
jgi:hypothetical protein